MSDGIDLEELEASWNREWDGLQPIGSAFRFFPGERWVRFHSLPESKRYAENKAEQEEILRRHNTIIDELVGDADDASATLLVLTCAYANTSVPTERDQLRARRHPKLSTGAACSMTSTKS